MLTYCFYYNMDINLHNFSLLHNHLKSILTTNNYEDEHLPEKIMQYIGMIVESDKSDHMRDDFFDFFCENNGNKILSLTLEVDQLLAVKTLSMLFINLHSQMWVSYLLCQPFVTGSIAHDEIPEEEEWSEYFISLLKSLSIRLNNMHLSLFYNKKQCKFPLIYEAIKYYNHPDCMVRTNVMNIILGVMKIKDPRLSQYFASFPFTSYILTFCCQVRHRINNFHAYLIKAEEGEGSPRAIKTNHRSIVKMYFIDISDYICYLNDLMELGPPELSYFIRNCILNYIVVPALKIILDEASSLEIRGALYLLHVLLKNLNDEEFQENICLLVMGKQIPKSVLDLIINIDQNIYLPQVYSEEFSIGEYFWNKYDYFIEEYCLNIFKDVMNFQIPHDSMEANPQLAQQFQSEIKRISQFLSFDILTYQFTQEAFPLSELPAMLGFKQKGSKVKEKVDVDLEKNPIRENIFKVFQESISHPQNDSLILTISTLLLYFSKCENIQNQIQKFCGLLLPRLDTVNYQDEFNMGSLQRIQKISLKILTVLNHQFEKQIQKQQKEEHRRCVNSLCTIRNMMILMDDCTYKHLEEQAEYAFHRSYTRSLLQLKSLITLQNMKDIVENFEFDYSKWSKQALSHEWSLPHSIFSVSHLPAQDVDLNYLSNFTSGKEKVQYYVRNLAIMQTYYFRYFQMFGKEEPGMEIYTEKFNKLYYEKFNKIEEIWKIGQSYEIGYRNMVNCFSHEKKGKDTIRYIIIEDPCNLVIVQPSNDENKAKIIINHPFKYVEATVDRSNGRKMTVEVSRCVKGQFRLNLFFENEAATVGCLEWLKQLKSNRYQSEQAFILNYLKECLSRQGA